MHSSNQPRMRGVSSPTKTTHSLLPDISTAAAQRRNPSPNRRASLKGGTTTNPTMTHHNTTTVVIPIFSASSSSIKGNSFSPERSPSPISLNSGNNRETTSVSETDTVAALKRQIATLVLERRENENTVESLKQLCAQQKGKLETQANFIRDTTRRLSSSAQLSTTFAPSAPTPTYPFSTTSTHPYRQRSNSTESSFVTAPESPGTRRPTGTMDMSMGHSRVGSVGDQNHIVNVLSESGQYGVASGSPVSPLGDDDNMVLPPAHYMSVMSPSSAAMESLKATIIKNEAENAKKIVDLEAQLEAAKLMLHAFEKDNANMKSRISSEILLRSQINRLEMASRKAVSARLLRLSGQKRVEAMESALMCCHDDMYYVTRFDGIKGRPIRDVTFVFIAFSGLDVLLSKQPPSAAQSMISIYHSIIKRTAEVYSKGTYCMCLHDQFVAYSFQSAQAAMHFAIDVQMYMLEQPWPELFAHDAPFRPLTVPSGNSKGGGGDGTESGTPLPLFNGPRVQITLFSATGPATRFDSATGRLLYQGREINEALALLLDHTRPGEISCNSTWMAFAAAESGQITAASTSQINTSTASGASSAATTRNAGSGLGNGDIYTTPTPSSNNEATETASLSTSAFLADVSRFVDVEPLVCSSSPSATYSTPGSILLTPPSSQRSEKEPLLREGSGGRLNPHHHSVNHNNRSANQSNIPLLFPNAYVHAYSLVPKQLVNRRAFYPAIDLLNELRQQGVIPLRQVIGSSSTASPLGVVATHGSGLNSTEPVALMASPGPPNSTTLLSSAVSYYPFPQVSVELGVPGPLDEELQTIMQHAKISDGSLPDNDDIAAAAAVGIVRPLHPVVLSHKLPTTGGGSGNPKLKKGFPSNKTFSGIANAVRAFQHSASKAHLRRLQSSNDADYNALSSPIPSMRQHPGTRSTSPGLVTERSFCATATEAPNSLLCAVPHSPGKTPNSAPLTPNPQQADNNASFNTVAENNSLSIQSASVPDFVSTQRGAPSVLAAAAMTVSPSLQLQIPSPTSASTAVPNPPNATQPPSLNVVLRDLHAQSRATLKYYSQAIAAQRANTAFEMQAMFKEDRYMHQNSIQHCTKDSYLTFCAISVRDWAEIKRQLLVSYNAGQPISTMTSATATPGSPSLGISTFPRGGGADVGGGGAPGMTTPVISSHIESSASPSSLNPPLRGSTGGDAPWGTAASGASLGTKLHGAFDSIVRLLGEITRKKVSSYQGTIIRHNGEDSFLIVFTSPQQCLKFCSEWFLAITNDVRWPSVDECGRYVGLQPVMVPNYGGTSTTSLQGGVSGDNNRAPTSPGLRGGGLQKLEVSNSPTNMRRIYGGPRGARIGVSFGRPSKILKGCDLVDGGTPGVAGIDMKGNVVTEAVLLNSMARPGEMLASADVMAHWREHPDKVHLNPKYAVLSVGTKAIRSTVADTITFSSSTSPSATANTASFDVYSPLLVGGGTATATSSGMRSNSDSFNNQSGDIMVGYPSGRLWRKQQQQLQQQQLQQQGGELDAGGGGSNHKRASSFSSSVAMSNVTTSKTSPRRDHSPPGSRTPMPPRSGRLGNQVLSTTTTFHQPLNSTSLDGTATRTFNDTTVPVSHFGKHVLVTKELFSVLPASLAPRQKLWPKGPSQGDGYGIDARQSIAASSSRAGGGPLGTGGAAGGNRIWGGRRGDQEEAKIDASLPTPLHEVDFDRLKKCLLDTQIITKSKSDIFTRTSTPMYIIKEKEDPLSNSNADQIGGGSGELPSSSRQRPSDVGLSRPVVSPLRASLTQSETSTGPPHTTSASDVPMQLQQVLTHPVFRVLRGKVAEERRALEEQMMTMHDTSGMVGSVPPHTIYPIFCNSEAQATAIYHATMVCALGTQLLLDDTNSNMGGNNSVAMSHSHSGVQLNNSVSLSNDSASTTAPPTTKTTPLPTTKSGGGASRGSPQKGGGSPQESSTSRTMRDVLPCDPSTILGVKGICPSAMFVYVDIEGSGHLLEECPDAFLRSQQHFNQIVIEAVKRFDGYIVKTNGQEAFLIALPGPTLIDTTSSKYGIGASAHTRLPSQFSSLSRTNFTGAEDAQGNVIENWANPVFEHIFQEELGAPIGHHIRTPSKAAGAALQLAIEIQTNLLHTSDWPNELLRQEGAQRIKDPRTNLLLFNGLRARVGVSYGENVRTQFNIETRKTDFQGNAIREAVRVGKSAPGGDIWFTSQAYAMLSEETSTLRVCVSGNEKTTSANTTFKRPSSFSTSDTPPLGGAFPLSSAPIPLRMNSSFSGMFSSSAFPSLSQKLDSTVSELANIINSGGAPTANQIEQFAMVLQTSLPTDAINHLVQQLASDPSSIVPVVKKSASLNNTPATDSYVSSHAGRSVAHQQLPRQVDVTTSYTTLSPAAAAAQAAAVGGVTFVNEDSQQQGIHNNMTSTTAHTTTSNPTIVHSVRSILKDLSCCVRIIWDSAYTAPGGKAAVTATGGCPSVYAVSVLPGSLQGRTQKLARLSSASVLSQHNQEKVLSTQRRSARHKSRNPSAAQQEAEQHNILYYPIFGGILPPPSSGAVIPLGLSVHRKDSVAKLVQGGAMHAHQVERHNRQFLLAESMRAGGGAVGGGTYGDTFVLKTKVRQPQTTVNYYAAETSGLESVCTYFWWECSESCATEIHATKLVAKKTKPIVSAGGAANSSTGGVNKDGTATSGAHTSPLASMFNGLGIPLSALDGILGPNTSNSMLMGSASSGNVHNGMSGVGGGLTGTYNGQVSALGNSFLNASLMQVTSSSGYSLAGGGGGMSASLSTTNFGTPQNQAAQQQINNLSATHIAGVISTVIINSILEQLRSVEAAVDFQLSHQQQTVAALVQQQLQHLSGAASNAGMPSPSQSGATLTPANGLSRPPSRDMGLYPHPPSSAVGRRTSAGPDNASSVGRVGSRGRIGESGGASAVSPHIMTFATSNPGKIVKAIMALLQAFTSISASLVNPANVAASNRGSNSSAAGPGIGAVSRSQQAALIASVHHLEEVCGNAPGSFGKAQTGERGGGGGSSPLSRKEESPGRRKQAGPSTQEEPQHPPRRSPGRSTSPQNGGGGQTHMSPAQRKAVSARPTRKTMIGPM